MNTSLAAGNSLLARVIRAGSVTMLGNVGSQLLRFVSNLLLTRLLFPGAFGLMAIAQSILTAANLLSDVGLQQAVVRSHRAHDAAFLDTIWTMQILKGLLIVVAMAIAAPFAAKGYAQPSLVAIMPALGLASLVTGFSSTKVALMNRRIEVGRLTMMELGAQFVGIVVMLVWARLVPTTWALVGGNLASALARTLASYWLIDGPGNRLRWDRSVVQEVWQFGGWVMLASGVTFLAGEGRNLLNAALVSAGEVGLLVISSTLAFVVWNAIQQVSGRVLFPAYAEVHRERPHKLSAVVERSRRWQLLGGCAVATLFALFGARLVHWFYDPRYAMAGVFLQIQAVGTLFSFLNASYSGVLWALGRPGLNTVLLAVQVVVVALLTLLGHALGGTLGLVAGASCTGLVMYPFNALVFRRFGLYQPRTDWAPIACGILCAVYVARFGAWVDYVR